MQINEAFFFIVFFFNLIEFPMNCNRTRLKMLALCFRRSWVEFSK